MSDRGDDVFEPHLGDPWHPAWDADDEPSPDEPAPAESAPAEPAPAEPKKPKKGLFRRRRDEDPAPEEADQPEKIDADLDPEPSESVADELPADEARAESPRPATDAPRPAWLSEVEGESQVDTTLEVELPAWVGGTTAGADGVDGEFPDQVFDDDLEEEEDDLAGDSEETIEPVEEPSSLPSGLAEDPVELPDDLAAVLEALGDDGDAVEVLGGDELADEVDAEEIDEIPDLESLSAIAGGLKDPSPEEAASRSEYGVAGPEAFDALKDLDESEDLDDWHQFAGATGGAPRDPAPEVEPGAVEPEEAPVEDSKRGIWPFRRKGAVADEPAEEIIAEEPADWDDDGTAIPSEWFAEVDEDTVTTPPADLPETEWPEVDPAAAALPPAAPEGVVPDGWVDEVVDEPPAPEVVVSDQPGVPEVDGGFGDEVVDEPPAPEVAVPHVPVLPEGWVDEVGEEPPSPEVPDVPVVPHGWGDEVEVEPAAPEGAVPEMDGEFGDEVEQEPSSPELPDVPVLPHGWGDDVQQDPAEADDWIGGTPVAEPPAETRAMPSLFDHRSAQETQEFDPIAEGVGVTPPDLTPADEFEAPLGFDDGAAEPGSDLDDDLEEEEGYEDRWVTGPIELGGEYEDAADEPGEYGSMDELSGDAYQTSTTVEHRGLAEEILRSGDDEHEWQAMAAAMPGVESGVVGFDDVADLGDDEEYLDTRVRSDLGTRILTGAVLAGFFLGSLWVAPEALAGFIGLILLLGLGEFYSTVRRIGFRPLALFGFMGALALLSTVWFHGPVAIAAALVITAVVIFFVYAFSPLRRDALTNGGLTVLGLTWIVGSAAFSYPILASEDYRVLVLALVGVTAAMDIGAYAVGRAWGTRSLAPILSPNKSIEGLVGGIGLCMLAGAAVGSFLEPFDLMSGIGLGIVVVIAAPLGDLAESMFKRSLGVKDMGSILPGHGGILDRIDALLFVIPAAWAFYQIIGLLG